MKVFKTILLIVFGMLLGAGIAVGVYFLTVGEVAWKQYLEERLIPTATAAITSLLMLWGGAYPIIKKIITATNLFGKATENVNTAAQNSKQSSENLEEYKTELASQFNEVVGATNERWQEQDERLKRIERSVANTEKIARIGFGNTEELVTKGYAAEIAKVGDKDESETEFEG